MPPRTFGRGEGGREGGRGEGHRDRDRDRDRDAGRNEPMRTELTQLGQLIGLVARALVDHPEQVAVRESASESHPRIELTVAPDDIGKVIGKDGRTAQSIRTLLAAAAMRAGKRAHLDIVD